MPKHDLSMLTAPFTGVMKLVKNPEVIKIKVIKKKHLEQLGEITTLHNVELEIIGIVGGCQVIVNHPKQGLSWVHQNNLIRYWTDLRTNNEEHPRTWKEAQDEAYNLLDDIPQMFED